MAITLKYSILNFGSRLSYRILWNKLLVLIIIASLALVFLNIEYWSNQMEEKKLPKGDLHFCILNHTDKHYSLRLISKPYIVPPLDEGDAKRLIDLNNFEFTIVNNKVCVNVNSFLLVLVTSAPQNFNRRTTIRETWGQNDIKVKLFFLLAAVDDDQLQEAIETENNIHGDIVQGNFIDSYKNLTYKTVMALKYVVYHCPNITYLLKVDDDVFVNMPLMKNYLTNDLSPFGAENYLQCHVMKHIRIMRNNSKWAVSEQEFPGKEYPTYCNGPYSILSPDVVFKLYKAAQETKFFLIEDVFLYGVVVGKYPEIIHTDTREFALWRFQPPLVAKEDMNFLFGPWGMNSQQIIEYWKYVTSIPVPSSIYYYPVPQSQEIE